MNPDVAILPFKVHPILQINFCFPCRTTMQVTLLFYNGDCIKFSFLGPILVLLNSERIH